MSFNKQEVVNCLTNTLNNDLQTRQLAEQALVNNLNQPQFLSFLLNLAADGAVDAAIKLSAAIFVKNAISKYWLKRSQQASSTVSNVVVSDQDRQLVKSNLVQVLLKSLENHSIVAHLTSIVQAFLLSNVNDGNAYGEELLQTIETLLKGDGASNNDNLLTALLLTYELTRFYRWSILGYNITVDSKLDKGDQVKRSLALMNNLTQFIFPILISLLNSIVSNLSVTSDIVSDHSLNGQFHILYLVLKIFKYVTYNDLPDFLLTIENGKFVNVDDWIHLHFLLLKLPFPVNYTQLIQSNTASIAASKDYRIKSQKWAISNLNRLFTKHGGGATTSQVEPNVFSTNVAEHTNSLKNFQFYFQKIYLPKYFETFFIQIDSWHNKKVLLFDSTLYSLVKFFSYILNKEPLFKEHLVNNLNSLIQYLIFPSLIINQENLALFYEDDEEFFRKFYDLNNDSSRPDIASVNFLYKLSNKYFEVVIAWLFDFLNKNFSKRKDYRSATAANDISDLPASIQQDIQEVNSKDLNTLKLNNALETEASLRVLGILSYHLTSRETSPVKTQIDGMIQSYIVPEIFDHEYVFLTTRALETLATFNYRFEDLSVLSEAFKGIIQLIDKDMIDAGSSSSSSTSSSSNNTDLSDSFLVQVEALDALRSLLVNEDITNYLKSHINLIVSKLLQLISEYEIDFLTTILEEFISSFSSELKPFANELSAKLSSQFLKISSELLDALSSTREEGNAQAFALVEDKESQCIGVINNLSVMIESMNNEKLLLVNFSVNFDPCIKFVVHNSMIGLLDEAMSLATLLVRSLNCITRSVQTNFDHILEVFNNVGFEEFFDYFSNFFEIFVITNYNFKYYFENAFNSKIEQELQNGSNGGVSDPQSLQAINDELKNTLKIDYFTLNSDPRLLSLIKLNIQLINKANMENILGNINLSYTLFEDILLSVHNSSLHKLLASNNLQQQNPADLIFALQNINDATVEENPIVQSILENSTNALLNSIFVNLEEIVLLTEEEADSSFIDFDIVHLTNNFLKLLLVSFLYKPSLTIHVINNFDKVHNLLDLLNKIDNTNSTSFDELAEIDLGAEGSKNLAFFQFLNKFWISLNRNNSFVKMLKSDKLAIKLQILSILKVLKNEDSIKSEFVKNENSLKWFDIFTKKMYVKLVDVVAQVPKAYENEQKSNKANGTDANKNSSAAVGGSNINDGDDDGEGSLSGADLDNDLLEEDFYEVDNFNFNERMRLKLLNYNALNLNNGGGTNSINFKVLKEFSSTFEQLSQNNPETYGFLVNYIQQKNLQGLIEKALEIDSSGVLEDF